MTRTTDLVVPPSYRYRLSRDVEPLLGRGVVLFVMLNPSTADDQVDDPTIRRCIGFARRWGYARLEVRNLFALRSTEPAGLLRVEDPVGPDNDAAIDEGLRIASTVVVAWGSVSRPWAWAARAEAVLARMAPREVLCFGCNADGSPRHPLYEPNHAVPVIYQYGARRRTDAPASDRGRL